MNFFFFFFNKMTVKGNVEKPHRPQFDRHTRPSRSLLSHRSGGMHVQPVMVIYRCNSTWTLVKFRFSKHLKLFAFFCFTCSFLTPPHLPSPMRDACTDTKSLHREVMYKRFYYISLIKAGLYSSVGLLLFLLTNGRPFSHISQRSSS